MVCCNDPDNGNFAGRAQAIEVDDLAEFEAKSYDRPPRFRVDGDFFFLAGKAWPFVASKDWHGNWCWNAYWLAEDEAVRFFVWLHQRRLYSLTCGDSALFDRWRWREPLTDAFLRPFLRKAPP